jgi:hypothetical protein
MKLTEYDCSKSTAIQRIVLNKLKNELIVVFRGADDIYLYYDVPTDTEEKLVSDEAKGTLVNDIKKMTNFRKISYFPTGVKMYQYPQGRQGRGNLKSETKKQLPKKSNIKAEKVKKPRKSYKNYSKMWLDILANNTVDNREYLESLLPLLAKCHPNFPPARKPPPLVGATLTPDADGDECTSLTNAFSELCADSNSDSDEDEDDEEDHNKITSEGQDNAAPAPEVQCRYLIVRVICSIAENYRNEAVTAQREKDYVSVRVKWLSAWNELMTCQANIDEWCALLYIKSDACNADPFAISSSSPPLPKKHNRAQLVELFQALQLLIQDTERQKELALAQLYKRIQFVNAKLNPMLRDRNSVKVSMGEEKWNNNPEPKQTYAEKRKQWEEDLASLTEATLVVESLDFNAIYDSR